MDERYRTIKARFDSDCHWCGLPIKKGRTAYWNPVEKRIACTIGCILGLTLPKT